MDIPQEFKGKYFYHFTHIENLESILQHGFLSTNEKIKLGINHNDVANGNIQGRRHNTKVPISPNGTVHDYVPFYFCTTNPMLLGVTNKKNIDQPFLIFFAIPIDKIKENNVLFTDASANTVVVPNFYSNPEDLNKLKWEAINSRKWGSSNPTFLHQRMAEVLVYNKVPLEWISAIIVWSSSFKNEVDRLLKKYKLLNITAEYQPFKDRYFYYTKFGVGKNRDKETLVTGPYFLKSTFENTISDIIKERRNNKFDDYNYENIAELNNAIDNDFCVLNELDGIFELETENEYHNECVSDHTLSVVNNLEKSEYYITIKEEDKNILKLAAYLHDIGKGPHEKWAKKVQPTYPDHPVDSLKMIKRVLIEDIKDLSENEIKIVTLLVTYHDLIGEIFGKERDKKQLFNILKDEKEFDMLNCLSHADIKSFNNDWQFGYGIKSAHLKKEFLEQLSK